MVHKQRIFVTLLAICLLPVSQNEAQERTWSDPTGKHKTIAELVEHDAETVSLRKQNGVIIEVPLSRLSAEDLLFIQELSKPAPTVEPRQETTVRKLHWKELEIAERSPEQQAEIVQLGFVVPMASSDYSKVRKSLSQLKSAWPTSPSAELISQLVLCLRAPDKFVRLNALELLASYDLEQFRELVLTATGDPSVELRWMAYDCLGMIADDLAINQLIKKMTGEDTGKVSSVLKSIGSRAEDFVAPLLSNPTRASRLNACGLLSQIGTEKSLPLLRSMIETDSETAVRSQAKNAVRSIESRGLPKSDRQ